MNTGSLLVDEDKARKVSAQASSFFSLHGFLYFINLKNNNRLHCVAPVQMREQLIAENHSRRMTGDFSSNKLYRILAIHWWWLGMYTDVINYCTSYPQIAIVNSLDGQIGHHYMPSQYPNHSKSLERILWIYHSPLLFFQDF